MTRTFIIFFGPPGSGKGTQAELLSVKFCLPAVSTGALFRQEAHHNTALGEKIREIIHAGRLVDDQTVNETVAKRLDKEDCQAGAILDGYPRNFAQQEHLLNTLLNRPGDHGQIAPILVKIDDQSVIERLSGRKTCHHCGAVYHLKHNPPARPDICDKCGGTLMTRRDDSAEVIKGRLKIYHELTDSMLEYWLKLNKLIVINGEQGIKEMHEDIVKNISRLIKPCI